MTDTNANAAQFEFWNGEGGKAWAQRDQQMEKTLAPIAAHTIAAARPQPGEHVLDVGCGCGGTAFALLQAVGPTGRVQGVDISGPMLDVATATTRQLPGEFQGAIAFTRADASSHPFTPASYDLLFSRFGVMFFDDPVGAFAHMRTALKPGGRITFVCWAPPRENQWITIPMAAALQHLEPPEPTPPNAPGPFGLADRAFVEQTLEAAGYTNIDIGSYKPTMRFGHGAPRDEVANGFVEVGPVSRLLAEADPDRAVAARGAIAEAIMPYYDGETLNLEGSCWVVKALKPG